MRPDPTKRTESNAASVGEYDGFRTVFAAEPLAVRDALRRAVARYARRISDEDAGALELALAEVLNNVVEHAYRDRPAGPVELFLQRKPTEFHCLVRDCGNPLPGLTPPNNGLPPLAVTPEGMPEGGWGWALIRALTTDLVYARDKGCNRLTFRIPLTGRRRGGAPNMP